MAYSNGAFDTFRDKHWQLRGRDGTSDRVVIRTGGVIVNGTSRWRFDQMYGGVKDSGIGREGPKFSIRDMTEERLFVLNWAGGTRHVDDRRRPV
ncbi:aldehyde dehydrogenase family protein [Variovorax saccharolyticus]|uniref:aldehyde dehydrogenase family protein n=1 Tax=Variovorax saccharolyticus TaxID=3053516 RepID=UPI002576CDA6|nr:aldehyde dehydrogenase family protein [Variovorax sp. J31P216]MDM0028382.1 aldehyde dehydrogenase family protein [Variovorax sp. J31P216]